MHGEADAGFVRGVAAEQNGNLAELLQEPSLMGALERAGTVTLSLHGDGAVYPP
jgi:hypothetical protein